MYLTAKLNRPPFNRSEVNMHSDKQTNKQTPLKTYSSLRYATPVGKYLFAVARPTHLHHVQYDTTFHVQYKVDEQPGSQLNLPHGTVTRRPSLEVAPTTLATFASCHREL